MNQSDRYLLVDEYKHVFSLAHNKGIESTLLCNVPCYTTLSYLINGKMKWMSGDKSFVG